MSGWVQSKYARENELAVFAAPTPEEKLAVAIQYRDERRWGLHAANILAGLGVDPNPLADEAERTLAGGKHKVDFLKQPLPQGWLEICVHQLIAARAAQAASLATFGSCLIPLAVWSGLHYDGQAGLAEDWLQRARGFARTAFQGQGQSVVDQAFPDALDVFGGDGTANEESYCRTGVKTASNRQVRSIFVDLLRRDLSQLGLVMPDAGRGVRRSYKFA